MAQAFTKFDEFSLSRYSGEGKAYSLKDVLFLCHAKPINEDQAALWKRLINGTMATPDTWETRLSAGGDKKTIWEMAEGKAKQDIEANVEMTSKIISVDE